MSNKNILFLVLPLIFTLPTSIAQKDLSEINGVPPCAKQCALNYISTHPDCPLTTTPCICAYLASYSSCVAETCNGTDIAAANQPPIPYYIPEVTISIARAAAAQATSSCPLPRASNPVFTSVVGTTFRESSTKGGENTRETASERGSLTATAIEGATETSKVEATVTVAVSEGSAETSTIGNSTNETAPKTTSLSESQTTAEGSEGSVIIIASTSIRQGNSTSMSMTSSQRISGGPSQTQRGVEASTTTASRTSNFTGGAEGVRPWMGVGGLFVLGFVVGL